MLRTVIIANAGSLLRIIAGFIAAAAVFSACAPLQADQAAPATREERLFYELRVTLPGSKSQGVHGQLYDREGRSVVAKVEGAVAPDSADQGTPGATIATNAGVFVFRPQTHLWSVSGMVPDAIPLQTLNDPATEGPTLFRLYVSSECTRSEGWRGELTPAPEPARAGQTIDTPMGPFEYRSSAYAWGQHGWFPQAWPAPQMGAGHWPCG